jgi:hypothetical protein
MSEEDKLTLRSILEDDLILCHFGPGSYIRNEFGLWGDNKELLKSCVLQKYPDSLYEDYLPMVVHPDDAFMVIVEAVWRRLRQEEN